MSYYYYSIIIVGRKRETRNLDWDQEEWKLELLYNFFFIGKMGLTCRLSLRSLGGECDYILKYSFITAGYEIFLFMY